MVTSNLRIISGLKLFLESVSNKKEIRQLYTESPTDFSRHRQLTLSHTAGMIINMPKRSLSVELHDFFKEVLQESSCTKSAFSQQRSKLKPAFFQAWNNELLRLFYTSYANELQCWRGMLIQAVDGSRAYLPDKPELKAHFGTQDNQYTEVVMAQILQVHDILNDLIVWGGIYPVNTSEQAVMNQQVSVLRENSITLFDRGYPSFALIYLLQKQERLFVMRCKADFNNVVKAFVKSAEKDVLTHFSATENAKTTLEESGHCIAIGQTVPVRLVKVSLSNAQTGILITNLFDKQLYPPDDLSYLYSLRWPIETCFNKQKNQLQMEQFSGHRVVCVRRDYYATLFVANLQSLIEKQSRYYLEAISKRRKHPYKINRNIAFAKLKYNICKLFLEENPQHILLYLQQLFEQDLEPLRSNRSSVRNKKVNRRKGKFQTFTNYKRAI